MRRLLIALSLILAISPASADQPPPAAEDRDDAEGEDDGYQTTIIATRSRGAIIRDTRAVTVVDERQLTEAAPPSTSEALHLVGGVSVQKTNHAGGSPYIRGRTGQQTLLMIDGFRLNTSLMRSGPNQYLNTIDIGAVQRIEVLRGAGSVLYGSDAIGGVVNVMTRGSRGMGPDGRIELRGATADRALGGRVEGEGQLAGVELYAGISGRTVDDLRTGGALPLASVPVYRDDVQLFTGYDEIGGDAKARIDLDDGGLLTASALAFRQLDAPRTDTCRPEPYRCRFFDEQFYDLAYLRWDQPAAGRMRDVAAGVAFSRTHELRRFEEAGETDRFERDRVLTFQGFARASIVDRQLGATSALRISAGGDGFLDLLDSEARTGDLAELRGKYLDGSRYQTWAGFLFGELAVSELLGFTAGARLSYVRARVAPEPDGSSPPFVQDDLVPVFGGGVRVGLTDWLSVVGNVDQGFRAPNLDDLTARSSEGPGFQLPNPMLEPESSVTLEGGLKLTHPWFRGGLFVYQTYIDGAITREATSCPMGLDEVCGDAASVYQLINADSARVDGVEGTGQLLLPEGISVVGAVLYTRASTVMIDREPVPESKIPPLSGRIGVRFQPSGARYYVETIAEWARRQDRLSEADRTDDRIPPGGTPGYGVVHVRAGARLPRGLAANLTLYNLTDTGYRVHGSGVDAPGFGAVASLAARFSGH